MNDERGYIVGVDLGQAYDFTALAVLERGQRPTGRHKKITNAYGGVRYPQVFESTYDVRHLARLPRGTPYPQQVERVTRLTEHVRRATGSEPRLVVDQTGVGRPVVDMLRDAGHKWLAAVSIHGGDEAKRDGRDYKVPKRELVSVLQVLLQSKRLQVVSSLRDAETLTREMLAFKVTIGKAGHDSYGNDWRENAHDDLVLAVALAAWLGESVRMASLAALRAASGLA